MKKYVNNKGYIMTEAIIISAIVLTALILIYAQFARLNKNYNDSYYYNNVNGMYALNQVATYLDDNGITSITGSLDKYMEITDCSFATDNNYCNMLIDGTNIKHLLFTRNNKTSLVSALNNNNSYELRLRNFIKSIDYTSERYSYVLIAEFHDGYFAAIPYRRIICDFEANDVVGDYSYTGGIQEFTVPEGCGGTYKLEVWGGQGGSGGDRDQYGQGDPFYAGGQGGYAYGNVMFAEGAHVYIVVGGQGAAGNGAGGYNGGGNGAWDNYHCNGAGGGATHIGKTANLLKDIAASDVYIVAGGGSGAHYNTWSDDWANGERHGESCQGAPAGSYAGSGPRGQGANGNSDNPGMGSGWTSGSGGHWYYTVYCSDRGSKTSSYVGGSGYIGGVEDGGQTAGVNSGNGKAKITYLGN